MIYVSIKARVGYYESFHFCSLLEIVGLKKYQHTYAHMYLLIIFRLQILIVQYKHACIVVVTIQILYIHKVFIQIQF